MERFRARSILALVLVCGLAAYVVQVFVGIFIERDLAASVVRLGLFNVLLPIFEFAAAFWLWLLLRPLDAAMRDMAVGRAVSSPDRAAAREAADKVPGLVIANAVAVFILGSTVAISVDSATDSSFGTAKVIVIIAINLTAGFAAAFQSTVLIQSILRTPVAALGFHESPPDKKRGSLAFPIAIAGGASSALALVLLGSSGYAALAAAAPPNPLEFLLEALILALLVGLWSLSLFRTVGRTLAMRSSNVGELLRLVAGGEGDLSTRVPIIRNDEVSGIAAAFNLFLVRLTGLTDRVRELSISVEEGASKLNGNADQARKEVNSLGTSVEAVLDAVRRQSETVSATEGEISSLLESIDRVAAKVGEQSGFMDQSSAAVSEMAANIASVSRTAEKADDLATALQKASEEGGEALRASIASIAEIEAASRAVRDIIGVISKIAVRTNLLAMNAAIEAAHAGDAGRGFAVVADEVRSLAENAAKSAKEIEILIRGMAEKTERGTGLGDRARKAFDRIRDGVAQTGELVRTIAASMSEQQEGAEEILRSSQSLADGTRLIESLSEGQKVQSKGMEQSMLRIVSASNEIFEAVQEETGATQSLGRLLAMVGEEAGRNHERVIGLEEAVSRFKTGAVK
ncbi:MAG: HAMP domain-containing methyl-accepting chemotaxis protein [Rectinemataceae bacterium]